MVHSFLDTIGKVAELFYLYLRSQTRPKNVPLFIIFDYQLQILLHMNLSPPETATTVLLLGQSAFYSMGRNNSIATLDLLNGFNGLDESSMAGVMLQTILSNWIGPVWWSFAGLRLLAHWAETKKGHAAGTKREDADHMRGPASKHVKSGKNKNVLRTDKENMLLVAADGSSRAIQAESAGDKSPYLEYLALTTMFSALSSLALTLASIYTWGHEDLWNVLAPKFINASLWTFFHHFIITFFGCSCVWLLINNRS